ncbi:UNC13C [Branchiostoma lanceolatum]|uniref:UNC13C protein n=1 Tax=Branchiostoma lanceolatum TaxID=7740 RepID=A0A8K0A502_BRALA|nr:UNC13C [Branchiostoma lanceolatum]
MAATRGEELVKIPRKEWEAIVDRLQCLETRVKQLESNLDTVSGEVSKHHVDNVEFVKSMEFTQENVDELTCRMESQEKEQENTGKWLSDLELYGRRWNLLFHGVQETEQENCTKKVLDVIGGEMKLDTRGMRMCGVHRLGKPRNRSGKPRPIIARFTCRADRDQVWKNKTKLKNKPVFISDDVPYNVRELRKRKLVPFLKRAKSKGKRATIVGDRLVIEGESFAHWRIPSKWLQDAPEAEPENIQRSQETVGNGQHQRDKSQKGNNTPGSSDQSQHATRGGGGRTLRPRSSRGKRN